MNDLRTNVTHQNLLELIQEKELKEQIIELSKAYKKVIDKPFSIGVMGKSGAGKSSFVNSLCQGYVCETGGVGGCTREIQKIQAKLGEMDIHIYDFPGIAENKQWNKSYWDSYVPYLDKLDLIFWVIKIDDRAVLEDEKFYNEYINRDYKTSEKFVVVLSQADKVSPSREWDHISFTPSSEQGENIFANRYRIYEDFDLTAHRIIAIATNFIKSKDEFKTYGFDGIFNLFAITLNNVRGVNDELPFPMNINIMGRELWSADRSKFMQTLSAGLDKKLEELRSSLSYW